MSTRILLQLQTCIPITRVGKISSAAFSRVMFEVFTNKVIVIDLLCRKNDEHDNIN